MGGIGRALEGRALSTHDLVLFEADGGSTSAWEADE